VAASQVSLKGTVIDKLNGVVVIIFSFIVEPGGSVGSIPRSGLHFFITHTRAHLVM
jgi:hypothetical protein